MGMLSLLLWMPALGGFLLAWIPSQQHFQLRLIATLIAAAELLLSLLLFSQFDAQNPALQFSEYIAINPALGSTYSLGVDGLSLPLLITCPLLTFIVLLASISLNTHVKAFHICILLMESAMLGVLLAQDWVLFYIFWEIILFPLFFLISRWGGKRGHIASISFVFYTLFGSVFMLLSLFALSQYHLTVNGTLITALNHSAQIMPTSEQIWVLLGFLIGFGIKFPIFPLHGWLPQAIIEAPAAVSILIAGVLLKMAAYGLIRVLAIFPDAAHILQPVLVVMALLGILYGSLLAWRQSHLKALCAYASISQMGLVLLGISSLNAVGLNSALLQMIAHSMSAAALLLLIEQLSQRVGSRRIQEYGSLTQAMPRWSLLMAMSLFASLNMPSSIGFIAQLQTLTAVYQQWGGLWVIVVLSLLVSAAYLVRILSILFITSRPANTTWTDLQPVETLAASLLVAILLGLGLYPKPLLTLFANSATQWQNAFQTHIK